MRVTKDNVRYIVGWGGSPQRSWPSYETLDEALDGCRELAESDEDLSDEERESLDVWGESHETGWGVCPEGDDGGHGACVVAQMYDKGNRWSSSSGRGYSPPSWIDWPADPEEKIEIVDGPLYRVVTYLGEPAEEEHGTDLTLDEARKLCEEIAEDIARERVEDGEEPEEVSLYITNDDEGNKWGGCGPADCNAECWPIYEEM